MMAKLDFPNQGWKKREWIEGIGFKMQQQKVQATIN